LDEPDSHLAEKLWQSWITNRIELIAPYLLTFEVTAVLRNVVYRGLLDSTLGEQLLNKALEFDVKFQTFTGLHEKAYILATRHNLPSAYDAHYLALAEYADCALWTADKRLFNSVHRQLEWVNWLGNLDDPLHS
jgi:predicted nucleic acid-binding protein